MNDYPADTEPEPLDPALADKALQRLRAIVRGNGLKPDSLTLTKAEGTMLGFRAYERFTLESRIAEKMLPGKENGEAVGSQQEARNKIQSFLAGIARDPEIKKMTILLLKKREDIGFALDGQVIPLKHLRKTYVAHEGCTSCSVSGKVPCPKCHGQGKTQCVQCHGQKDMICPICRGTRFQKTAKGQVQCPRCHGHGRMACDMCQRTGLMACTHCRTTGRISCRNCNGTGWNSHMTYLEILAKSRFDYDDENLPPAAPPLIDAYGARLATGHHADIRVIEDQDVWKEIDQQSAENEYIVPYDVRLPFGSCEFRIGKAAIAGTLFGLQGDLPDLPPFMEKVAARGLRALNEAAHAPVNVAARLAEAARYRIISESLVSAARQTVKKSAADLKTVYPFGFTDKTLLKIAVLSHTALQRVARQPRLTGFAAGLVLSALLYGLYYMTPVRGSLDGNLQSAADALLPLAGGGITTGVIQVNVARTLRNLLDRLAHTKDAGKLMPKAGQNIIWGFGGAVVLYMLFLTAAALAGMAAPDWFEKILHAAGA